MLKMIPFLTAACVLALASTGCTSKKQVWIYTSLYKEMIAEMDPALHAAIPDADIKWYQGGSENVAAKINTEIAAGGTKADLVLTSDPFWYYELKQNGKLLPYESPAAKAVGPEWRDPDHAFVTVRLPVMVIGYNSESYKETDVPTTWKELAQPKYKGKLSMGSPLESGTMFTTVALLSKMYGWDFFKSLRAMDLVAAGGNSSVITRIETAERPMGVVLIENVLKSMAKGSPVRMVYPADGTVPVPSPIAIFKESRNPEQAKRVYDWFFTETAQRIMVKGGMYSVMPGIPAPEHARPWSELSKHLIPWSPKVLTDLYKDRDPIKAKFSEVVFH
jgi:iron(III) transport system substrate-binding protein